ncbi:chorismate mutase [Ignisphaera aggregans DSM 17230]|uniref:Chorismate mutase n=1 Tax=Ignisphaera aggregans (strain DSM 17230 / JCM 13409 / AQ1.S1) TaxID=583356 RepID=E0SS71_IGNAA|nr:chorismate mutase [Ignisphaera aggregans DSM 17230]
MEIEDLRKEIEEIDREIIKYLAKRLDIVKKIGRLKIEEGKSASDDERELYVKNYWRELSTIYGVPVEMAKELIEIIIKYSKYIQLKNSQNSDSRTITFIGYGRMGKLLALYSIRAGHRVIITGRDPEKAYSVAREVGGLVLDIGEAIERGEFIVLALSLEAFRDGYIDRISRLFKEKIVMDILSSKTPVFSHMEELSMRYGFIYISTHPLFGPQTTPIGEKIAVIPSKTGVSYVDDVCKLWRSIGLDPIVIDVETHEKAMAVVQVLTHLYLLAFQQSLEELSRELGVDPYILSTPTFRDLMNVIRRLNNIKDVVLEIQKSNLFSEMVRSRALSIFMEIVHKLGDKHALHS